MARCSCRLLRSGGESGFLTTCHSFANTALATVQWHRPGCFCPPYPTLFASLDAMLTTPLSFDPRAASMPPRRQAYIDRAFAILDKDGNGTITLDELMARLPSHAATTGLEVSAEERQAAVSCGVMVRERGGERGKEQRGLDFGWAGGVSKGEAAAVSWRGGDQKMGQRKGEGGTGQQKREGGKRL